MVVSWLVHLRFHLLYSLYVGFRGGTAELSQGKIAVSGVGTGSICVGPVPGLMLDYLALEL